MFRFFKQSEFIRMLIIAVVGAVLGFVTYETIYYFNPFYPKATLSWFVAFVIGVARQHWLHRYYTFQYKIPYIKSLYRTYIVDFGALFFSSGLNWFLSEVLNFNHRLTWLICLLASALISLMFIKKYIFKVTEM